MHQDGTCFCPGGGSSFQGQASKHGLCLLESSSACLLLWFRYWHKEPLSKDCMFSAWSLWACIASLEAMSLLMENKGTTVVHTKQLVDFSLLALWGRTIYFLSSERLSGVCGQQCLLKSKAACYRKQGNGEAQGPSCRLIQLIQTLPCTLLEALWWLKRDSDKAW